MNDDEFRNEIEKILNRLEPKIIRLEKNTHTLTDQRDTLAAQVAELRAVVEHYASEKNWYQFEDGEWDFVGIGGAEPARAALEKIKCCP